MLRFHFVHRRVQHFTNALLVQLSETFRGRDLVVVVENKMERHSFQRIALAK